MILNLRKFVLSIMLTFLTVYFVLAICIGFWTNSIYSSKVSVEVTDMPTLMSVKKLDKNLWIGKNCVEEMKNFVFIKCMKCATETTASIFRRFGYVRDLNFVLPVKRNLYLGWPFPLQITDIRTSKSEFNILAEHSIFNYTFMKSLMPNDTKFITILRNPWDQFKSTFNYFDIGEIAHVPGESVREYLEHIEYYDKVYTAPENNWKRWCIPDGFSLTRNILSHCLGMPLGFPRGSQDIQEYNHSLAITDYIKHLDSSLSFVMIADYFVESLVLLKRIMCWKFKDILYHHSNIGEYRDKNLKDLPANGRLYQIHRNWSSIDYLVFEHFNKTFWEHIRNEGFDFYDEVGQFRGVQAQVDQFCIEDKMWKSPESILTIPDSKFGPTFNVTGEECVLMSTYLLPVLWARHFEKEGVEPEEFPNQRPAKGCSM